MDVEAKVAVVKSIAQEVVTEQELRELFESNDHPIAYDGFEPSGKAHLPIGVYRPLLLKELLSTGVKFNLLLADSYAWINEKMGGDLEKVRVVGKYFLEVWKAAGVPMDKVTVVWHKQFFDDPDYWKKVILVAKSHSEARTKRALTIAGRKEEEISQVAQLFYPSMQAADVFQLDCDLCQLGMDQRKANMLCRDVAEKLKWKKPVVASHRMLLGLDGIQSASASDEGERRLEKEIDAKMSKSKPNTCIFVHDGKAQIADKIAKAYCPPKITEGNPVLEYAKEIVFRSKKEIVVERPQKFGGNAAYNSFADLEKDFCEGKLHPMDLKNTVARELDELITPIRTHFEKNTAARKLYEQVAGFEVTR